MNLQPFRPLFNPYCTPYPYSSSSLASCSSVAVATDALCAPALPHVVRRVSIVAHVYGRRRGDELVHAAPGVC